MNSPETLRAFEEDIAEIYVKGEIPGPVHLRDGNEFQLLKIFESIAHSDIVFSTWASHLHALCHNVPPEKVKEKILAGKSISLQFPPRFYTSALVGGICPIAVGMAWSIKKRGGSERVWAFIGDMTAFTGIFQTSLRYTVNHELPLTFIIEDNGKSVYSPTPNVWKQSPLEAYVNFLGPASLNRPVIANNGKVVWQLGSHLMYYQFESKYAHHGIKRGGAF